MLLSFNLTHDNLWGIMNVRRDGEGLGILVSRSERDILVYGDISRLHKWMKKLSRPKASVLMRTVERVANLSRVELMKCKNIFRFLPSTNPRLYEIRHDQARLFCVWLAAGDITVVHWIQKKDDEIPDYELETAQKRAKELLGDV